MTLVVDATVALAASGVAEGFSALGDSDLAAPPLMWSEARSVLHEMAWRGEIDAQDAATTRNRLEGCPVTPHRPTDLADAAWQLADELGWAKTYGAEYVALARLLGCRLVTLDARLRRGTARLGIVVGPTDL